LIVSKTENLQGETKGNADARCELFSFEVLDPRKYFVWLWLKNDKGFCTLEQKLGITREDSTVRSL
jgi:hypothetical protein